MDVSKISLREVVLHSIPKAKALEKEAGILRLSDLPASLDATRRLFLEDKIKTALGAKARPVVEDPAAQSPAAQAIRSHLKAPAADRDLVAMSKQLANFLYQAQPGISPAGVVLVADLDFAGSDALLLAKLDREVGMRAFETNDAGQLRINIDYLTDLFVTAGTKVFKIGIFTAEDIRNDQLVGNIVDEQAGANQVARYFMHFLGCDFRQRPEEVTEHFFHSAEDFINSARVPDAEAKARYSVALLAAMQSQSNELNVRKFAHDHLDKNDRDAFVSAMTERGVTAGTITKNTSLVQSRLKRVQIETDRDIFIMAPPDRLKDGTITVKKSEGQTPDVVEVTDTVKRVTSHS